MQNDYTFYICAAYTLAAIVLFAVTWHSWYDWKKTSKRLEEFDA